MIVIWIVINEQGPIQAYTDQAEARRLARQLGDAPHFRVVSCTLVGDPPDVP
jgi:hypothetical protein